jgi:tetratricopeptide (TPR) repeat protein
MTEDIKDKKFQRTANMLKLELQKNPQNIYYRFQLSTSYAMHGDIADALSQAQIYMRSIKDENIFSDNYLMFYSNAVILYISCHLLEEASLICDEALKIKPEFIDFIYHKALICYELGEYDSAIDYSGRYLSLIDNFMSIDIANDGRYSFYSLGQKYQVLKIQILSNHRLGNYDEIISSITSYDNPVYKDCLHGIVNSYLKTNRYSDAIKFYNNYCCSQDRKLIFRYFLEDYIQKSNKRDKQICISILTTLNCYDGYTEELENRINFKDCPDINEGLYVIRNYDIDSLNLDEAKRLFNRLLPAYNSFTIENSPDIMKVFSFKMLGLYILHRSVELKGYKDYSTEKQINILRKYMSLSSYLIMNKSSHLLDAKEQLFLIKITEAFKKLGIGDYTLTILLLNEAIEIYKPMEGIIKHIQKNVVPNYKNSNNISKPINVISADSEIIESYANVVKKKILEEADKNNTRDILQVFKQFNNTELYDSELFSYKAVLLMSEGLLEDARFELDEGLKRFPDNTQLLGNLCRLYSLTHDFNKALEIFCRVKILSKGKSELELSQLVPNKYYTVDFNKLKVLQGTMFPDNRINNLAAMLSKKGVYTKILSYSPKYTGYTTDYVIDMNQYRSGAEIISKTLDAAAWLIPKFDIFHFHYGSSLSFDYSDLYLLNELGKKIFVQFWNEELNTHSSESKVNS